MIIYEVHVEIAADRSPEFESYMRDKHLPEILDTGCFTHITFERESPAHYRTRYHASSKVELDRYLDNHTAGFRADFQAHFPEGVHAWREVWEQVGDTLVYSSNAPVH